ncbi:MAG: hypothetical protein Kow0060_11310 [Methylohalobius crimeensis]
MSDDSRNTDQPDFAQQLEKVARDRRARMTRPAGREEDWEPEEDTLELSTAPESTRHPRSSAGRPTARTASAEPEVPPPWSSNRSGEGDGRLWVAVGLGGAALVIVLVVAALLYRQSGRIEHLGNTVVSLEERLQAGAGRGGNAAYLRDEVNRMKARLGELEHQAGQRLAALEAATGEDGEALRGEVERLNEAMTGIEPRLDKLERRLEAGPPSQAAKPSSAEAAADGGSSRQGWYIVLASFNSRAAAEKLRRNYAGRGVHAEIQSATVQGKPWYRLRVGPFTDQKKASDRGEDLRGKLGLNSVWLSR